MITESDNGRFAALKAAEWLRIIIRRTEAWNANNRGGYMDRRDRLRWLRSDCADALNDLRQSYGITPLGSMLPEDDIALQCATFFYVTMDKVDRTLSTPIPAGRGEKAKHSNKCRRLYTEAGKTADSLHQTVFATYPQTN